MQTLCLVLLIAATLVGDVLLWRVYKQERRGRGGMDRDVPAADDPAEKKPDPMDEGFENLMRYEVNGKTGFEPGEE